MRVPDKRVEPRVLEYRRAGTYQPVPPSKAEPWCVTLALFCGPFVIVFIILAVVLLWPVFS